MTKRGGGKLLDRIENKSLTTLGTLLVFFEYLKSTDLYFYITFSFVLFIFFYILWIFRNYLPKITIFIRLFIIVVLFLLFGSAHKIIKKNNIFVYSILILLIIGYIVILCYTKLFGIL